MCESQATGTKDFRRALHYLTALAALNEATQADDVYLHRVDTDLNTADALIKGLGAAKKFKIASRATGHNIYHLRKPGGYASANVALGSRKEGEHGSPSTVTKERSNLLQPS